MKPIHRIMWMATDADGYRWLFDNKPEYGWGPRSDQWYALEGNFWFLDKGHKLKHPELSLKKVIVTIEEEV